MKIFWTLFISVTALSLNAQVEISGAVKNYNDSIFYISETGGFHNFTRAWRDKRVKVTIDKRQHFKVTVPEELIGTWYLKTTKGEQYFDLIAGKNLVLLADFSKASPLYAIGANSGDFNYSIYLNDSTSKYYSDKKFFEKIRNKNIDSVLFYRKEFATFKTGLLNKYRSTHEMSDIYCNWVLSQYLYEPFERAKVENIKNHDSLDDATVSKIMEKGINDQYAALNTTAYNDLIDFYITSKIQKLNRNLSLIDRFNFVADNDILKGSTKEVYLSRFMAWMIKTPDSIYGPLFKKYNNMVHNEKMKQSVISRRNDYINPVVTSTSIDSSRANSMAEIFKKYRGKVIYVDFWASWCVPCRAEMPNAVNLKQKLSGKNIVFIYLGYNDKEKAWLNARNQMNIEGEHFLLNEKMIKEADEIFGINGIPHYAIIDKEGRIVSKHAGRPNDVYEQLLNLLEK